MEIISILIYNLIVMKRIVDEIFAQNSYVINVDDKIVIVDPGYNYEMIKAHLITENLKPDMILLTHFHFDHVASVDVLAEDYNIKAHIHEDDYSYLIRDTGAELLGFAKVSVKEENVVSFRDTIEGLPSFKVHHLPGHSEGSCIFEIENQYFTGDILFQYGTGRVDLPGSNPDDMEATLKAVRNMNKDYPIHPGHGEECKLGETSIF